MIKRKLLFFFTLFSICIPFQNLFCLDRIVIIEAENYFKEDGGVGILSKTKGRIESSGNECIIAWNNKGHAVYWNVDIPETGVYKTVIRYANSKKWNTLRDLEIDGAYPSKEFQKIVCLKTGGLSRDENNWYNHTISDNVGLGHPVLITLTKGKHIIRMNNLGSELNSDGATNFDLIAFIGENQYPDIVGRPGTLPKDDYTIKVIPNGKRYLEPIFENLNITRNIIYSEAKNEKGENQKLALDIYSPQKDAEKERPVFILFHGGGLRSGSKEENDDLALEFAKRGFVVMTVEYRLRSKITEENGYDAFKDACIDAVNSIKWILNESAKYNINKNKIFLGGESAGGSISLALAYNDSVITYPYRNNIAGVVDLFGTLNSEIKNKISLLIIHADTDSVSSYQNAVDISKKAESAKINFEFLTMKGGNHTYNNQFYTPVVEKISLFFYKILKSN